ncbi:2814_t:CDS:2, partial [Racocetra fulgida]
LFHLFIIEEKMSANSDRKEIINNGGESKKIIDKGENFQISGETKSEEKNGSNSSTSNHHLSEKLIESVKHGIDTLSSTIIHKSSNDQESPTQHSDRISHQSDPSTDSIHKRSSPETVNDHLSETEH